MRYKIVFLIAFLILSSAQSQSNSQPPDSTLVTYANTDLGISFQYRPDVDYFDTAYPIAKKQWHRHTEKRFGLSFLSPKPYKIQWERREFWEHECKPAADSVLVLYYGEGVTLQIYQTEMSLTEIAYAEGFKQSLYDTTEIFSRSIIDSIPEQISDTCWVMIGVSGFPYDAFPLNGPRWRGLRGQYDTRATAVVSETDTTGEEHEYSTSYSAEVYVSFLTCPNQSNAKIVFLFQNGPCEEDAQADEQPQRLSETGFYDLVASVKWIKKK